jgi:hypothetical protein
MDGEGTDLVVRIDVPLELGVAVDAFTEVHVSRPDLEPFAREAGLTEEQIALFRGAGGPQLVTARKRLSG